MGLQDTGEGMVSDNFNPPLQAHFPYTCTHIEQVHTHLQRPYIARSTWACCLQLKSDLEQVYGYRDSCGHEAGKTPWKRIGKRWDSPLGEEKNDSTQRL